MVLRILNFFLNVAVIIFDIHDRFSIWEVENPFESGGAGNCASLLPILRFLYKMHRFESLDGIDVDQPGDDCWSYLC